MLLSMIKAVVNNRIITTDSDFEESEHPRDNDGKFANKGKGKSKKKQQAKETYQVPEEIKQRFADLSIAHVSGKAEHLNQIETHLSTVCKQFPKVKKFLSNNSLGGIDIYKDINSVENMYEYRYSDGLEDSNGIWFPPTEEEKPSIVFNENFAKFQEDLPPLELGNHVRGISHGLAPLVLRHELGHHVQYMLGRKQRKEWDKLVDANPGVLSKISRYAQVETEPDAQTAKYSEGFAESFAAYTHPEYKAQLPEPIHQFLEKNVGKRG